MCNPLAKLFCDDIELTALLEQYLRENQAAINVKLSDEEIAHVRKLAEISDLGGLDRYPSAVMGTLFRDTTSLYSPRPHPT